MRRRLLALRSIKNRAVLYRKRRWLMLYYALVFFVVAIVAGVFGFLGIAAAAAGIARILFFIFLVFFLVSLLGHVARRRKG